MPCRDQARKKNPIAVMLENYCRLNVTTESVPQYICVCCKKNLRAPVCKNQTNLKFRGKSRKFDFFHILMLERLGYN